ncbi:MAG: hypothetical protein C5B51_08855 [Terriglobia bacterium]|nr:MAG: hypothetical protein C5B51_08855 [Terriglobia bacterium]
MNIRRVFLILYGAPLMAQVAPTPSQMALWNEYQQSFVLERTEINQPGGLTVSAKRLRHNTPTKAWDAFNRSLKFVNSGSWARCAVELEKAVAIDPGFPEAHSNLAVTYIELLRFDIAAEELRQAVKLDPSNSVYHANLALALILLHRPQQAQPEAQTAVSLDPVNRKAQFLLGYLLSKNGDTRAAAAKYLNYAAPELPAAHYFLAQIYQADGLESLARSEMDRYRQAAAENK